MNHSQSLEKAKSMFPNMPDEVFNLWLAPLIESDGWPFTSVYSSTRNTVWFQYFHSFPLQMVSDLLWYKSRILCPPKTLHKDSFDTLILLIDKYVMGNPTIVTNFKKGKGKYIFDSLCAFIKRTGGIPTSVILIFHQGKYAIVDGNHRMAALYSLCLHFKTPVNAWIGNLPAS
jgi:hypothetical protein